jgi:hypothetical protein
MLITTKIKTKIVPLNFNRLKIFYPEIKYSDIIEIEGDVKIKWLTD